jgi:hypothetical protein
MSIVQEKYQNIAPKMTYLSDEVILAQAWKKTNTYIRRHNWYADVLELDCSTIDLENKLAEWATEIENRTYKVDAMRLVLAPKNKRWFFSKQDDKHSFDSWSSRSDNEEGKTSEQKLRPLAHLKIKDQTVATAVMLCLADAVETAQGPTDENDFLIAQQQKVYSYGNRLHCDWEHYPNKRKSASFGWGNSKCYRQYYEDYKNFLQRSRSICQHYDSIIDSKRNLYVVSFDLKEFFDHIDTNALIGQLQLLYSNYFSDYNLSQDLNDQDDFWAMTADIFNWYWEESDLEYSETNLERPLPKGIPQGLVAGGFFSNAYLYGFDKIVGNRINRSYKNHSLLIRDYCRYVDDIRLVVEVDSEMPMYRVEELAEELIDKYLETHLNKIDATSRINLNQGKTKVIPYRQLSTQNNVSSLMNMFQSVLSGTPDAESLRQAAGGLDSLLQMSDQLEDQETDNKNRLDLSKISTPHIDVRDDTLKRFVATRMVKSLRLRRGMTNLSEKLRRADTEENLTAGQMLDHEFETAARKLIGCWAGNPSLTLVLRCGLDLFPDPCLLVPIIDALKSKMYDIPDDNPICLREMKSAEYISADLLKAAATEIGYRPETVYPESADLQEFREELAIFAREIISDRSESPWYVKQQAILFLISIGDYGFSLKGNNEELHQYSLLQEAKLYRSTQKAKIIDRLAVSIVAQQISPNTKKYVSWFIEWMNKRTISKGERKKVILTLFMNRPDLMVEIINSKRMRIAKWSEEIPSEIKNALIREGTQKVILEGNKTLPLLRVIQSESNPFYQENAILLLAKAILTSKDVDKMLEDPTVNEFKVKCKDWRKIQDPTQGEKFISVTYTRSGDSNFNQTPTWIPVNYKWVYSLGRILRSCLTGEHDFTSHTFLLREDPCSYKGIRSTWYTRRLGLNNHPQGLLREPSPITPWLSELLIRLLQWPGIRQWGDLVQGFEKIQNTGELLRIIEDRIEFQSKIFGRLSNTPFYILPSPIQGRREDNKLQVAIVQPLLPQMSDFNAKDPMHWTPSYRAKHRNHIASICNLVSSHLKSTRSAQQSINVNSEDKKTKDLDLIVFPELTVHPDDIDLLRGLSDATKANIFAGLTFICPNTSASSFPTNQALWILRIERSTGREFRYVYQGKQHMTKPEKAMKIRSYRPYQVIIELKNSKQEITRLSGAICYDATDLSLVADLKEVSDIFVIAAMNKDVQTFDNMVSALHYHMYQPVILANTGEFGGSTVQAPFTGLAKQIAHVHGNQQISVSMFEVDASLFKGNSMPSQKPEVKGFPAGYKGRD